MFADRSGRRQFDGSLPNLSFVDRLHNPVLHQHVFEFVHGDGGWDNALALIGVNLYCQVTVMMILVANSGTGASRARCVTLTHG